MKMTGSKFYIAALFVLAAGCLFSCSHHGAAQAVTTAAGETPVASWDAIRNDKTEIVVVACGPVAMDPDKIVMVTGPTVPSSKNR
jgi:hypothetical protein